ALVAQGHSAAIVRLGSCVEELGDNKYAADLGSADDVTRLIALVNHRQGLLGGIIHLLPLRGGMPFAELDYQGWKNRHRLGVKSLFHLARAASKQLREHGAEGTSSLIAATSMGGAFLCNAFDRPALCPEQGGVAGLMKTLTIEWPEVRVKSIDLNPE